MDVKDVFLFFKKKIYLGKLINLLMSIYFKLKIWMGLVQNVVLVVFIVYKVEIDENKQLICWIDLLIYLGYVYL